MSPLEVPSSPPLPDQPAYYREVLLDLAITARIVFEIADEFDESRWVWWATYRLTNPHGSSAANYLGSSSGTTKSVAREHAA
jgi:hypothetical protein